jgi:hypothetical protein
MSFLSFSHLVGILSCHVLMLLVDSVNPSLFHVFHLDVFCVAPETFIATSYLKCVWRPLNSTVFLAHSQWISYSNTSFQSFGWLVVWNILLEFPFSWEFHNPNCRTPSFFRGVGIPPTSWEYILCNFILILNMLGQILDFDYVLTVLILKIDEKSRVFVVKSMTQVLSIFMLIAKK